MSANRANTSSAAQGRIDGSDLAEISVTEQMAPPYRSIGWLKILYEGNTEPDYGTGFVIDNNHIVTAAHCVFDAKTQKEAVAVEFNLPFDGTIYRTSRWTFAPSVKGSDPIDIRVDYAVLTFDNEVFEKKPKLQLYSASNAELSKSMFHIPGWGILLGTARREMQQAPHKQLKEIDADYLDYLISTLPAMSGCPVIHDYQGVAQIVAIHSRELEEAGKPNYNQGVRVTPTVLSNITLWSGKAGSE